MSTNMQCTLIESCGTLCSINTSEVFYTRQKRTECAWYLQIVHTSTVTICFVYTQNSCRLTGTAIERKAKQEASTWIWACPVETLTNNKACSFKKMSTWYIHRGWPHCYYLVTKMEYFKDAVALFYSDGSSVSDNANCSLHGGHLLPRPPPSVCSPLLSYL